MQILDSKGIILFEEIKYNLSEKGDIEKIKVLSRFFKTSKGGYAEMDSFIGVKVPDIRSIAKKFFFVDFNIIENLIKSKIHEERLCALFILIEKFKKGDEIAKCNIFNFYMSNIKNINNWDLVDLSAPYIMGAYLFDKNKTLLYKLSESENFWERRISIVSTLFFIRNGIYKETLDIAQILVNDKHDLIQKATGWALREVGKKEERLLITFLDENYRLMPRTMLRYAIEKLDKEKRIYYMK